jgi:glycosyltransferase involved in cell wall biosynthesis
VKVIQWNASRKNQPMSGFKRYEDELYKNIKMQKKGIEIERVYRPDNPITGNTIASWFLTYKSVDADIVHATIQTLAPVVYIRRPKRFIVTVLDLIPLLYPSILEKLQWIPTPRALKKVDGLIAISDFTKKELIRVLGISESKIYVVHLAADANKG